MRDIHLRHMTVIHKILGEHGLHAGQPRILFFIDKMQGAPQSEIARALLISPASLAMSIRRMEKAGLLEKSSSKRDQRANTIRVTQHGHQMLASSMKAAGEADRQLFSGFTPEEIKQFATYLDRVYNNLTLLEEAINAD